MNKVIVLIFFLLFLNSCDEKKRTIEKIDFTTDYKFTSDIEEKVEKDTTPWKYQESAVNFASKGDYKNALKHWDLAMGTAERNFNQAEIDSIHAKYEIKPAKDYLLEIAENEKIVIINEAHHNSLHRFFTRSLLKDLYDLGYKNLGLEALANGEFMDSLLMERKYPIQETGWYIKEPQFGNLVRDALEIGYELFAYEFSGNGGGKAREIEQARNIEKVINSKPNEKFLIHCGFAHAYEGDYPAWEKAMAGRITEYTGIDPLTINQVLYSEKSKAEYNHPLLKAFEIEESSVLVDQESKPLGFEQGNSYTDLAVLHPTSEYENGRPNWMFTNGTKKATISLTDIELDFPVLLMAFNEGEAIHSAVPVDILEVDEKNDKATLALKEGSYVIVVTNGKETVKFDHKVE